MGTSLSLRKRILFFTVPYIILIALLALGEGLVRWSTPYISNLELFTKRVFDHKVRLRYGQQIFEGDVLLGWKLEPNLSSAYWDFTPVSTNQQGMRYPKNIERKQKDTVRVVVLGDSVVFGYRVPVAFLGNPDNYDQTWLPFTTLMEKYWRENNPGKRIEVIPLAVPGYSSYQGLRWLEREIDWLDPDLVIVHFGWNDTEGQVQSDRQVLPQSWWRVTQRKIISQSQLLAHLARKRGEAALLASLAFRGQPELQPRVSEEEYVENIMAMAELAKKYGAETLVLGQVYRDTVTNVEQQSRIAKYRQSLAVAMRRAGIPYLEIEKLTEKGYPENNTLFGEAIHPNHLGHQLMAEEIRKVIKEEGLLNLNF